MRGASNHNKATTLINTLDPVSVDLVIPRLPERDWTYDEAKCAVLEEFGGEDILYTKKSEFSSIKFKRHESLNEFADRFYHNAQVLLGSHTIKRFDVRAAMRQATSPYTKLHQAMVLAYAKGKDVLEIVEFLQGHSETFNAPNKGSPIKAIKQHYDKPRPQIEDLPRKQLQAKEPSTSPKKGPYCGNCQTTNHWRSQCPQNRKSAHVVTSTIETSQEGKDRAD